MGSGGLHSSNSTADRHMHVREAPGDPRPHRSDVAASLKMGSFGKIALSINHRRRLSADDSAGIASPGRIRATRSTYWAVDSSRVSHKSIPPRCQFICFNCIKYCYLHFLLVNTLGGCYHPRPRSVLHPPVPRLRRRRRPQPAPGKVAEKKSFYIPI